MTFKVLVVDDSKLARMSIARLLGILRPDWMRVEAANAAEAVECQAREDIDLALIDFNMPGRDGLELAGELRRLRPVMPMAIISANTQDEILANAKSIDVGFLPKPLTQEVLAQFLITTEARLKAAPA